MSYPEGFSTISKLFAPLGTPVAAPLVVLISCPAGTSLLLLLELLERLRNLSFMRSMILPLGWKLIVCLPTFYDIFENSSIISSNSLL